MKFVLFVLAIIGSSLADPLAQNEEITIANPEGLTFKDFFAGNESDTDSERIIGGAPAPIERFPWQLNFRYLRTHVCGGSILSATRGLTAAQCIVSIYPQPHHYQVLVGTISRQDVNSGFHTPITHLIPHPSWNRRTMQNDIAVIWFANPLPLGPRIRPIALPPQNAAVPYGVQGVVSGWGLTRDVPNTHSPILLYTVARAITNQECNRAYNGRVIDSMVCAGIPEGGRSACRRDEGSALVVGGVQVGIVSWGRFCARPNLPFVYTRISHFTDWIRSLS